RRAERWVVISGEAVVTLEGEDIRLSAGDTIFIPKGAAHRMNNPGSSPLVFGEVQLGDYFGEDDIIRLQDDYGRSG
ncbi:MAG: phosphomannose isomerase type II C-terminal cupin domain, partial [Nitrospinota bacterium]|nr:phosphomannose isomerase type II C-terminal cupin domain [Nitrospinota bacterium]